MSVGLRVRECGYLALDTAGQSNKRNDVTDMTVATILRVCAAFLEILLLYCFTYW